MVQRPIPNDDIVYRGDGPPEHHSRKLPARPRAWLDMTEAQRLQWQAFYEAYQEEIRDEDRKRALRRHGY